MLKVDGDAAKVDEKAVKHNKDALKTDSEAVDDNGDVLKRRFGCVRRRRVTLNSD